MDQNLIIVGASTRAAAQSALRAGYRPWLADMFGDVDLQACGPTRRIDPYPQALADLMREAPDSPWMYTGAIENYPKLIETLASERPVWGNAAEAVRRVRDPLLLAETLSQAGLLVPKVQTSSAPTDAGGVWLRKSIRSAGGRSIVAVHDSSSPANSPQTQDCYFQQRIAGRPVSAAYVAYKNDTKLLGLSTQLIGNDGSGNGWCTESWSGAQAFWYAGSIGPLVEPPRIVKQAAEIGKCVATAFGLIGLFGIDAILTEDALWPLEVNPRYTASVEVLERSLGLHTIALHAAACQACEAVRIEPSSPVLVDLTKNSSNLNKRLTMGKIVLYAKHDVNIRKGFLDCAGRLNSKSNWPTVADIPHRESVIPKGAPICTVFANGKTTDEVLGNLSDAAKSVFEWLNE